MQKQEVIVKGVTARSRNKIHDLPKHAEDQVAT
jgi:hypothetical protein